jgi:hypothetical protein
MAAIAAHMMREVPRDIGRGAGMRGPRVGNASAGRNHGAVARARADPLRTPPMVSGPAERLRALLTPESPDREQVADLLDGMTHGERMAAITALSGPALQAKLYAMGAGAPVVTPADLVPPDATPLREVIFHGKNSLPMFSLFQKRFCRPPAERGTDELWGYNHQTMSWATGPGYFVVHREGDAPAAIDYRRVPPQQPPGWPAVKPNDAGLSRFVYKDMIDYLRRVSRHVLIGHATKGGKSLPNYFVLCRES